MKSALITTLFAFTAASLFAAAKDEKKQPPIPKEKEGRWGVYSFEDAKKEATKKKQMVAFLVTDDRAEEASVKNAALTAFWGLDKEATMVVLPASTAGVWKERLPAPVYPALTDKATAKEFPRVVVMDHALTAVIGSLPAPQIIDGGEKAVKEFAKQMKDINKDPAKVTAAAAATPAAPTAPAPAPAATPPKPGAPPAAPGATPPVATTPPAAAAGPVTIKDAKAENWTNAQGRTIQATLVEVNGDSATLLVNGNKVAISVATLSPESQKRVEELKAASAK